MTRISSKGRFLGALARQSNRVYRAMNCAVEIELRGRPISVPLLHGTGLRHLSPIAGEEQYIGLLERILALRDGAVLDVGANTGRFMMYVALADRGRQYFGFEPLIRGCHYIEELIRANRLENHSVLPMALGERTGVLSLKHNSDVDVCATTTEWFYGSSRFVRAHLVPTSDGDSLVQSLLKGPVALIKCDVEGGELEVLTGLRGTIARDRPLIIVEVIPAEKQSAGPEITARRLERSEQLQGTLAALDYLPYRIVNGDQLEPRSGLMGRGVPIDSDEMDYLCVPRELDAAMMVRSKT